MDTDNSRQALQNEVSTFAIHIVGVGNKPFRTNVFWYLTSKKGVVAALPIKSIKGDVQGKHTFDWQ